ncbi:GTPase HflX [Thiomicrospira sp. R3]|uniref:ribosome rescue GTPase HflX n=1 Tax=Thiomicrospira sp. R3 TaxID=3035472 RepID=UPI00259BB79C|nr:ribosome rescue GTPase HflX [Thiomicrospira sp. R3]WFE68975.1 GTPase HflX [Thiomicrospira sp. R3]
MELFGRIERKALDSAVLVHVDFDDEANREDLDEFHELVDSAGAEIVALITTKRASPDAKYFVGSGKAQEIADAVAMHEADVVIVNHALSPAQERNLERLVQCRVIDRVGLILDIFAQRARSHEGKLQVELAQLRHMSTRLIRGWTHLERQKGGIGLRGPGETQLETDRRLLQDRIKQLLKRIDKVRQQRRLGRRSRKKSDVPTVTIIGYTNAGKSTLFNQLTSANVYAEDRLFATLDATLRSVHLPGAGKIILADTVGFIRHIPHDLVAAFRSTLEETSEANLLIHLVDSNDPLRDEKIFEVQQVIDEVGAQAVPQLLVFNKIDQLDPPVNPKVDLDDEGIPQRVWISAKHNQGMDLLQDALASFFKGQFIKVRVGLPAASGQQRAKLYQLGKVEQEAYDEQGQIFINMTLTQQQWQQVKRWPDLLCIEKT